MGKCVVLHLENLIATETKCGVEGEQKRLQEVLSGHRDQRWHRGRQGSPGVRADKVGEMIRQENTLVPWSRQQPD